MQLPATTIWCVTVQGKIEATIDKGPVLLVVKMLPLSNPNLAPDVALRLGDDLSEAQFPAHSRPVVRPVAVPHVHACRAGDIHDYVRLAILWSSQDSGRRSLMTGLAKLFERIV